MGLSFWQIAIVVVLLVLLFGRGKITALMGDLAGGIKSFKKGMNEEDDALAANNDKAAKVEASDTADKESGTKS